MNTLYNLELYFQYYTNSNKCILFESHRMKNVQVRIHKNTMEQYLILSLTIFEVFKLLFCTSLRQDNYRWNNNITKKQCN
ncbi:hypothetical protein V1478_012340 [Vespula squamosa]|uniref:Uncharacterized protein n=1 Tax=Vespula squamosa TaxID=30214 RepID=A0ABD2ACX1_VESSQ